MREVGSYGGRPPEHPSPTARLVERIDDVVPGGPPVASMSVREETDARGVGEAGGACGRRSDDDEVRSVLDLIALERRGVVLELEASATDEDELERPVGRPPDIRDRFGEQLDEHGTK